MTDSKRVDDDDGFKKEMTPPVDPQIVQWPESLKFLPCSKWSRHTWRGVSALFCGVCCQGGLGIINIWGNLVGTFTSKFRGEDPNLSIKSTLFTFPLTYVVCSMSMQLGSYLLHKIDLRLQLLLGMAIFSAGVFLAQFPTNFDTFLFFYSFIGGVGFGIVYFLPVLAAWSFFPTVRPLCAGTILSSFSFAAIGYAELALQTLNPNNEKAPIRIKNGLITEKYFAPDSSQVAAIPSLLTHFALIAFAVSLVGIPFITWNYVVPPKKKNPVLTEVGEHLPFIPDEAMQGKYDFKTEIKGLTQIDKKTFQPLIEATAPIEQQTPLDDFKRSLHQISILDHKLLIRMGTGLKKARVTEEGLFATTDWSWYNQRMCLKDKNFWKLFVMLFSSVTYCFFVKVGNKVFGSLYHENDSFLTITSMEGYFFAACARFAAPILMQKIGFFKTYSLALIIEIVLATTFVYVAKEPHLFRIWVIVSLMCEGTHFSIFPPLSGQIYGPVLQIPINALFFIAFGGASMFGVWLNSAVVPAMGYTVLYNILAAMAGLSMYLNFKLEYTFETYMPFVKNLADETETPVDNKSQQEKDAGAPAEKTAHTE